MKARARRLLGVTVSAVALPLLLAGCFSSAPNPNAIGVPHGSGTGVPAANEASTSISPTPSPTTSALTDSDAAKLYKNSSGTATKGHNAQEIGKAVYSAEYIMQSTYGNKYMLNGGWSANNYDVTDLEIPFRRYFEPSLFEGYQKLAYKIPAKDIEAQNAVFLVTPYFPKAANGEYQICGKTVCQKPGYPKVKTSVVADTAKPDTIYVKLTVENRFATTLKDGTVGYIPDTTTVELNMVPNTTENKQLLPYVIGGWKGTDGKESFVTE